MFVNLVPVFAAFREVVVLIEPFETFHAIAMTQVLGGIPLFERSEAKS